MFPRGLGVALGCSALLVWAECFVFHIPVNVTFRTWSVKHGHGER